MEKGKKEEKIGGGREEGIEVGEGESPVNPLMALVALRRPFVVSPSSDSFVISSVVP